MSSHATLSLEPLFCHNRVPLDDSHLIAALSVFTHESHLALRRATRLSWWANAPADVAKFFTLRGNDLLTPGAIAVEAQAHNNDMLLVNASSALPRSVGPLATLLHWYSCAGRLFPTVKFFGKLDDDVWIDIAVLSASLRVVRRFLSTNSTSNHSSGQEAIVGRLEAYHWSEGPDHNDGPAGWKGSPPYYPCLQKRGKEWGYNNMGRNETPWRATNVIGPFAFPKGQTFVVPRGIADWVGQ